MKDVAEDKQVCRVLARLRDDRIQDWVSIHHERLLELTFEDFLAKFKLSYLPKDWEEITHIELLQMTQGEDNFRDFAVQVQAKNSTLTGTNSHMDETQLRHHIEAGVNTTLALCCHLEKVVSKDPLAKWLEDVKRVDGLISAERENYDAIAKKSRETARCTNVLTEPSRHTYSNVNTNATNASNRPTLPKLTSVERQLLYDNEGRLKCRRVFVPHRSTECPNDFPDAANYKPLTQSFINLIKKRVKKPMAAVASSSNNENAPISSASAPVAAVMGMLSNPTAYTALNLTNVIEGDSLSDESVSAPNSDEPASSDIVVVPSMTRVSSVLTALSEEMAPLTVPHLYWKCAVSGAINNFPIIFDALMDHGADTVFISDRFATELDLKRRKLLEPMSVEMAMPGEGKKQIVHMSQWVKLQLYDPSGTWKSKSIRAVVAPSLCSPVILGLPFLSHNKIVVDHDARTAITKDSGFDLLHPKAPEPKPVPKKKLKQFFRDLQEERKLMITKLKMVCAEHRCMKEYREEVVKPIDNVAAIRKCIETLTAIEQLNHLGQAVKEKYKDVFSPIPHIDDLPSDVYCCIQLKDANKTFTTRSYSTP